MKRIIIMSILVLSILITGCAQQDTGAKPADETPIQGEAVQEAAVEETAETEAKLKCNATGLLQEGESRLFTIEGEEYTLKADKIAAESAELSVNGITAGSLTAGQAYTFEDKSKMSLDNIVESSEGKLFVEFCFIAAPYEPVTCTIGDANFDGVLNMTDKVMISRMTQGSRVQKIPKQVCCVDTNKDGAISMQDVTYALKYMQGMLPQETCTS